MQAATRLRKSEQPVAERAYACLPPLEAVEEQRWLPLAAGTHWDDRSSALDKPHLPKACGRVRSRRGGEEVIIHDHSGPAPTLRSAPHPR